MSTLPLEQVQRAVLESSKFPKAGEKCKNCGADGNSTYSCPSWRDHISGNVPTTDVGRLLEVCRDSEDEGLLDNVTGILEDFLLQRESCLDIESFKEALYRAMYATLDKGLEP